MFMYKDDMYCECEDQTIPMFPDKIMLATAYIPFQHAKCIYSPAKGLSEGSIFPDLVMPYMSEFKHMPHCSCREEFCDE